MRYRLGVKFGERVKQLRREAGMRQGDLGEEMGWGKTHACRIENGWMPSLRHLPRLAGLFGLSVQEFLDPVVFEAPRKRRRA